MAALEGVRSRCGRLNLIVSEALGGGRSCGDARESILVQGRRLSGVEQDADGGDRLSGVCHGDVVVIWVRWVRGREIRPKQKLGRSIILQFRWRREGPRLPVCQPVLNYELLICLLSAFFCNCLSASDG